MQPDAAGYDWAAALAAAALLWLAAAPAAAQPAAPADSIDAPWETLFNGRNLDGWQPKIRGFPAGENFGQTFRVENGLLTVAYDAYDAFENRFGHLFSETSYSHYRLRLEYRFVGEQAPGGPDWARRNSGVMLHSQPAETMGIAQDFPISAEVQFLGGFGEPRSTANLCTPGTNVVYEGRFTTRHCLDSSSATFDGDQWVSIEVLVLGDDSIVHYVNGDPVIEYTQITAGGGAVSGHRPGLFTDGEPIGAGHIALQSESHPVQFRRIEILDLAGCMDPAFAEYRAHFLEMEPGACRTAADPIAR